jgi:hypothetical protein
MYTYYNNCHGGMLRIIVVASFFKTKLFWSCFALRKWSRSPTKLCEKVCIFSWQYCLS